MKRLFCGFCIFFSSGIVHAQIDADMIRRAFHSYHKVWNQPQVELTFSQEKYAPGDTAFFQALFFDQAMNFIQGKQLLYLVVIGHEGRSVVEQKFLVNDGIGANQIILPRSIDPGIYRIYAFNDWLKNFGPQSFFKKDLIITGADETITPITTPRIVVEGGSLVGGVPNRVFLSGGETPTLTLLDDNRIPVPLKHNGTGTFDFIPLPNKSYSLSDDEKLVVPLPSTKSDGCSVLLRYANGEPEKFTFYLPKHSTYKDRKLYAVTTASGTIIDVAAIQFNDSTELALAGKTKPGRLHNFSLLDDAGNLVSHRNFFVPSRAQTNANVDLGSPVKKPGEKVKMKISLQDNGVARMGIFSVSIINLYPFSGTTRLSSHASLFELSSSRSDNAIDQHLMFLPNVPDWKRILNEKSEPMFPFRGSDYLRGSVLDAETNEPVPDNTKVLFFLHRYLQHYQTFTQGGKVQLTLPNIFHADEFFYLAESERGKRIPAIKIIWDKDSILFEPPPPFSKSARTDSYGQYTEKARLIDESYRIYGGKTPATPRVTGTSSPDLEDELMGADVTVSLDNYIPFPTIADVIREVIPSLYYRRSNGKNSVRVTLDEQGQINGDPVYVIDGTATDDTDFFLAMNPSDIETIKIIRRPSKLRRLELMGQNGIVIVTTKTGSVRPPLDDPSKIYNGISPSMQFNSTRHSTRNDQLPTFRSTVYWNPIVRTDSNGEATIEFFLTDDVGGVQISIKGITDDNRPFSETKTFTVTAD